MPGPTTKLFRPIIFRIKFVAQFPFAYISSVMRTCLLKTSVSLWHPFILMANNRVQLPKIRGYRVGLRARLASLLKCSASHLIYATEASNAVLCSLFVYLLSFSLKVELSFLNGLFCNGVELSVSICFYGLGNDII